MSIKNYYLLFFLFTYFQVNSASKKETLSLKVSFLFQEPSIDSLKNDLQKVLVYYNDSSDYKVALEKALEIEKKYKKSDLVQLDFKTYSNLLLTIGKIYRKGNSYSKSLDYYIKAMSVIEKNFFSEDSREDENPLHQSLSNIYLQVGNGLMYLSREDSTLLDSAKYYYQKTLDIDSFEEKVLSYQASASSNLSGIYMKDSLFDKAEEYALKAVEIHKIRNNKISEAVALGNLASIFLEEKKYDQAKQMYLKAIKNIKNDTSDKALRVREQLYYNLAWNLYKLRDPEAYYYQEESYKYKDSLRDREFKTMIEEITSKFNFESQKEILIRDEENKRLKAQRTFSIVSIFAVVIILSLLYWLKLNKLKLQETEYEKNQELAKIQSELQVKILNATIDGRESERKQIAETLHDSVSALLSSANLHLQATRRQLDGKAPEEMDKTQQIIHEATDKIRDLSHNLISSVLLKFGLNYAVTELAEKYSNSELQITTEINAIGRYNQQFEIKINNIIQEFVNNILKHSKASKATIKLKEENNKLYLSIEDNGVGFDRRKTRNKDISGIGINQIEARIQLLRGKFKITSAPNKGTKIEIEVPIVKKETIDYDYPTL